MENLIYLCTLLIIVFIETLSKKTLYLSRIDNINLFSKKMGNENGVIYIVISKAMALAMIIYIFISNNLSLISIMLNSILFVLLLGFFRFSDKVVIKIIGLIPISLVILNVAVPLFWEQDSINLCFQEPGVHYAIILLLAATYVLFRRR